MIVSRFIRRGLLELDRTRDVQKQEICAEAQCNTSTLRRFMAGSTDIRLTTLEAICQAYGTTISDLICYGRVLMSEDNESS